MYKRNAQGWLKHLDFILWDIIILQAAFILAYMVYPWISHTSADVFRAELPYQHPDYKSLALVLVAVDILVCVLSNTMHNVMKRGFWLEFIASVKQAVLVLAIMSLYLFSVKTSDTYSRIILYLTAGFHLLLGYIIRILWKPLIRRLSRNRKKASMILVADESAVERVVSKADELDGFEYVGIVLSNRKAQGETIASLPVVADLDNAADFICRMRVDEVFVYPEHLSDLKTASYEAVEDFIGETYGTQTPENRRQGKRNQENNPPETDGQENKEQTTVGKLIEQCREMALPVHVRLPITSVGGKSFIEKVGGYNVLTTTANYAGSVQLAIKRLMDIIGGIIGSFFALIVIAIIGPIIKKQSPGPILFKQTRIGKNGKRFQFYKIRSMVVNADEIKEQYQSENRVSDGMMFKLEWDPRIIGNKIVDGKKTTGIGEFIRKTSLDEFPQFFNVLKGDMSLVGTRPPTLDEWEKYQYHHRARLACKPGLTGMWQVSGRSDVTDFEEVVRLDTEYINNWSVSLDIKILLKTIKAVLKHEGAM